jgi:hypothetical protein
MPSRIELKQERHNRTHARKLRLFEWMVLS